MIKISNKRKRKILKIFTRAMRFILVVFVMHLSIVAYYSLIYATEAQPFFALFSQLIVSFEPIKQVFGFNQGESHWQFILILSIVDVLFIIWFFRDHFLLLFYRAFPEEFVKKKPNKIKRIFLERFPKKYHEIHLNYYRTKYIPKKKTPSSRKRIFILILGAVLSYLLIVLYYSVVHTKEGQSFFTLFYNSFSSIKPIKQIFGFNNDTQPHWQLLLTLIGLPILFIIWLFRDQNKLLEIETARKDTNLKEFQQLQQWATGNIAINDVSHSEEALTLQISALHQLRSYLKGSYGDDFKRPSFEIYRALLDKVRLQLEENLQPQKRDLEEQETENFKEELKNLDHKIEEIERYERRIVLEALQEDQIAQQLLIIVEEEWFALLVNHEFPMSRLSLVGVDLSKSYLAQRNLSSAFLQWSNLRSAHFEGAILFEAHFEGAILFEAHFEGAILFEAHFEGANLLSAHFEGADLSSAHFEGVYLIAANFEGADLRCANFEGADLKYVHFEGADLSDAHFEGAYLREAHLEGADLRSANFEGADLRHAHLEGADLRSANFEGADLRYAHFEGANLMGAHFEGAYLSEAHLEGADLREAHLQGTSSQEQPQDEYPRQKQRIKNNIDRLKRLAGVETDLSGIYRGVLELAEADEIIARIKKLNLNNDNIKEALERIEAAKNKETNLKYAEYGIYDKKDAQKVIQKIEPALKYIRDWDGFEY